jgi:hypothetical protein
VDLDILAGAERAVKEEAGEVGPDVVVVAEGGAVLERRVWVDSGLAGAVKLNLKKKKKRTDLGGRRGRRDVFETLCGRNVLELLEVLNGRRLHLRIRLIVRERGNGT